MSRAEELAQILKQKGDGDLNEVGDKWGDWVCIDAAAHLRALDASHQRLVEATKLVVSHINGDLPTRGWLNDTNTSRAALHELRAALESAQALSNQVKS